jgi:hypothetical protein
MPSKFFVTACSVFISLVISAQGKKEAFELAAPQKRVSAALYNSIRLVDIRTDPDNYGVVQIGAFGKTTSVVIESPLEEQLKKMLRTMIFSSQKDGELVLVLRHLNFAELHTPMGEKGYVHFRATLFAGENGQYRMLTHIDTAAKVQSLDVTQALFRKASQVISEFIARNLGEEPIDNAVFSSNELNFIEIIEKKRLPAFTTRLYANGIYRTYEDFARQEPESAELKVQLSNKGKVRSAEKKNKNGKFEKILFADTYAFVYDGKPYIVTAYDYYPIERKIGDFYFTGKAKNQGDEPAVITSAIFFGIMGALIASEGSSLMEMKIDHLTGGFIRLREARQ